MKRLQHSFCHIRQHWSHIGHRLHDNASRHPLRSAGALLAIGLLAGMGLRSGLGMAQVQSAQAQTQTERARIETAQREVNAMGVRLAELQAQANRLNALGERLARNGDLADGEFDFTDPVPQGGVGPVRQMTAFELRGGMAALQRRFDAAGEQLSLLDSLLASRQQQRDAVPSRLPILGSYITSPFGGRADPFSGGSAFHKGIDFAADIGDPVLAVANGVVTFSADRSGYGHTVEIDHGNGYVTRYAHNSKLGVQVGDLVRAGQEVAKAGSSGKSTGAHVHFEVWRDGQVLNPRAYLDARAADRG